EIILSVESLALDIAPDSWKSEHPEAIASLQDYKNEASQNRLAFQEYVEDSRRPFGIEVSGRVEYPEDDAMYGTYFCDGAVSLGRADTLAQAIQRVKDAWISDDWNLRAPERDYYDRDLGHDCGPVSFRPVTITISDLKGNIVLTGDAKELEWHHHITCQADINKIQDQQKALREEAAYENGWDNHETARQLRGKAEHLNAGIVSEAWRGHPDVTAAINAFVHPRVELDEEMMFEADQPESWC
ncbi:Hok/Gef family protein, partial [Yokenella regensburgei]